MKDCPEFMRLAAIVADELTATLSRCNYCGSFHANHDVALGAIFSCTKCGRMSCPNCRSSVYANKERHKACAGKTSVLQRDDFNKDGSPVVTKEDPK